MKNPKSNKGHFFHLLILIMVCHALPAQIQNGVFKLIDADNDTEIYTFTDDFTWNLNTVNALNIVAEPTNSYTHVKFILSNGHTNQEGVAPYAAYGDVGGDYGNVPGYTPYFGFYPTVGTLGVTVEYKNSGTVVATDTFTITFIDSPTSGSLSFVNTNTNVAEGAGSVSLDVTYTGAVIPGGFSVQYSTTDGTAQSSNDYTSATGTIVFIGEANDTRSMTVNITDDSAEEGDETFFANLNANGSAPEVSIATPQTTITIQDNDGSSGGGSSSGGGTSLWSASGTNIYYNDGNVGIGTDSPDSKLHIYIPSGSADYPTATTKGDAFQSIRGNNNGFELGNSRGYNDRKAWILARHSSVASYGKYYSALHLQPDVGDKSQYRGVAIGYSASENIPLNTHLAINGKVGIGTLNPDAELAVKGTIHAEEVLVDLNVPGPDYVFKEDYELKSLKEVEDHIKEHGHLPNIPSALEMEKNGIELGEMNMKLLEKIEELTLYMLEMKKRQMRLEMENKKLQDQIEKLNKL